MKRFSKTLHTLKTLHPAIILVSFIGIGLFILNGYVVWQMIHSSTRSRTNVQTPNDFINTAVDQSLLSFTKSALLVNLSPTAISVQQPIQKLHNIDVVSTIQPTNTPISYEIAVTAPPSTALENTPVPISWIINGPPTTIHDTRVFYGSKSSPGDLSEQTSPDKTTYTDSTKDFASGVYAIPLWFTANLSLNPESWYYRIYALVNGKHYWSNERQLTIMGNIKDTITFVDATKELYKGGTATLTWEINGKATTIQTTLILISDQSITGEINPNVPPTNTPYRNLCTDYVNGSYTIPLRFVCNVKMDAVGTYFIRAYTFINGNNLWSEERQILVK